MNELPIESVPKEYFFQAGDRFGVKPENMSYIGGFENAVYSFEKGNQEYVLRVGHCTHMSFDLVQAELDWILYLSESNVPVTKPLASDAGIYVEKININDNKDNYLNAVAFEKAEGQHLDHENPRIWNKDIIKHWGKIIGRMHALAQDYTPKSSKRYEFGMPPEDIKEFLAGEDKEVIDRIISLFQDLEKLPKTKDSHGIVHSDLHTGNFFVKDNRITTLLDFDRTCYKWFISEIAIALYYPLYMTPLRHSQEAQKDFIRYFLPLFWEGYKSENQLEPFWKEKLNTFIEVRDAILYMYLPSAPRKRVSAIIKRRIMGKDSYIDVLAM
ncbi:MAG: phosphotransferase enzyme family protein [Candidatus Hodarchaeota archaeon]